MKKLLLCLLLGANLSAYSQFYLATVTEFTYPAASTNLAARSEHSSAYSYSNLIGLKIDNQGNFLIPAPTQVEYSMVADQLNEISPTLSIALSGSNIQSSGLFMAFAHLSSGGYSMSIKATDWVDAHFRPTDMEDGRIEMSNLIIYPNPFNNTFKLQSELPLKRLQLRLLDPLGRLLLHASGDLPQVNQWLLNHSRKLAAGNYFLQVMDEKSRSFLFKLSKTN